MSRLVGRLLNVRREEASKVAVLVIIFFLFITGTAWAETIIESSFYYLAGVSRLSQVFTLHALVSLIATAVYSAFVDQTSNQKLLVAVCAVAVTAICLGIFLLGVNQILAYTILYVLVRAVRTSFVIHWWNYASDFYDARASKRIVPVINAGSRFAVIVAGLTIPLLNAFLTPTAIILLWVATLLIIAMLSWVMNLVVARDSSRTTISAAPKKEHVSYQRNIREGFQYVSSSNYLRWLALSTFLMVIVFALLNYQGGLIFAQQFKSRADMTNFIGYLNGLTNLVMLPVQLFLFSRFVSKIGVGNANVVFPLGTFLISGSVLLAPVALSSGALAHFDRNTFRYSTQESSNNLLYNAVPARVKGRARSFIDGLVLPVGLLASSALLEVGKLLPSNLFLPVLLGLPALAFLGCSLVIRKLYSRAMITLLEQEDYVSLLPGIDDVSLPADPAAKNILLKKLADSSDDAVILLIAGIMTETAGTSVLPILELKARESAAPLRAGIIAVLANAEIQSISRNSLIRFYNSFLSDPDARVRLAAFNGLQLSEEATNPQFLERAASLLQDEDYEIRSQALASLFHSSQPFYIQQAESMLAALLQDPAAPARICALRALGTLAGSEARFLTVILEHLDESADEVRLQAALALQTCSGQPRQTDPETGTAILTAAGRGLNDPLEQVRLAMLTTLEHSLMTPQHKARAYELIAGALADPSPQVRQTSAEILLRAGEAASQSLLELLDAPGNISVQQTGLKMVLCRINARQYGELVDEQIVVELKAIYARNAQLNAIQGLLAGPGGQALRALLSELNNAALSAIFELLSARYGEKSVQRIRQSLAAESSRTRANASEALEALINPALVKLIMPLFDSHLSKRELAQISVNTWGASLPSGAAVVMRQLVSDPQNEMVRAFGAYALGEIIPGLAPSPAADQAETSENNPAPGRRPRRLNLLDKLLEEAPSSAQAPAGVQLISLADAQELLSNAQNDPDPDVRGAAQAALRMTSSGTIKPMPEPGQAEGKLMTASLSVIERIIFLKQVTLFQSMTMDQLKVLASICEDESVTQGSVIFKEGDPGGGVYVVVNGRVGIERAGERKNSIIRLANLEARASFGEMNMFEDSPRSASAVAIEDSLLLKLRSEPFMALIRQHPDMSLELIKVLSTRLREANDQIAHLTRSTPRQLQNLYDRLEDTGGAS
jgi:CRP-like cAMP-binding protein/ATP/ADP translocase